MFAGLKGAIFSKTGMIALLGFFTTLLANMQGQLGAEGTTITIGAAFLAALGIAARTTLQKLMEMFKSNGGS